MIYRLWHNIHTLIHAIMTRILKFLGEISSWWSRNDILHNSHAFAGGFVCVTNSPVDELFTPMVGAGASAPSTWCSTATSCATMTWMNHALDFRVILYACLSAAEACTRLSLQLFDTVRFFNYFIQIVCMSLHIFQPHLSSSKLAITILNTYYGTLMQCLIVKYIPIMW